MNFFRFILIVPLAVLVACSSSVSSDHRASESGVSSVATISGQEKRDGFLSRNWDSYYISSIDGEDVSYFLSSQDKKFTVSPGLHKINVSVGFNRSTLDPCPCNAVAEFSVEFRENHNYIINGSLRGDVYDVWIEDSVSGNKVSNIATSSYHSQPVEVYVPLFY